MTRLPLSAAAAGLLRALLRRAGRNRDRILLSDCRSIDWQSLTFIGERHQLRFRIDGPDAGAIADEFVDGLSAAELTLAAQIVADISAGAATRLDDGSITLQIEALTIAD